jgi:hypothetical protein
MYLGAAAGGLALATGGAVGAGMLGATGAGVAATTATGAAVGGAGGALGSGTDLATQKVIKSMEKDATALEKVQARIDSTQKLLDKQNDILEKAHADPSLDVFELDSSENKTKEVDRKKLIKTLADNESEEKAKELELEAMARSGMTSDDAMFNTAMRELADIKTKKSELNELKGINEKIENTQRQIYDLTGKRSGLKNKDSSSSSSSGGSGSSSGGGSSTS